MEYTYTYQSTNPDRLTLTFRNLEWVCKMHRFRMTPVTTISRLDTQKEGIVYVSETEFKVFTKKESVVLKMRESFHSFSMGPITDKIRGYTYVTIWMEETPEFIMKFMYDLGDMMQDTANECNKLYDSLYYWENPSYYEYADMNHLDKVSTRIL
jgi:hypothetical protein